MRKLSEALYKFYWAVEQIIVPGLRDAQYAYKDIVAAALRPNSNWLDLGCGHHVFGHWMTKEQAQVIEQAGCVTGLDYEYESVRQHPAIKRKLAGDVYRLPFQNCSFDIVTANMVVEHLSEPTVALAEIHRVLRPGGIFVFHTPNVKNYQFRLAARLPQSVKNFLVLLLEGRSSKDVFPTHYKINTLSSVAEISRAVGFDLRDVKAVNSSAEAIMLGPLVIPELLITKLLSLPAFGEYRSNLLAVLRKPAPDHLEPSPFEQCDLNQPLSIRV